jgi:hypothetical protein
MNEMPMIRSVYSPIERNAGEGEDTGRHCHVGYEVADSAVRSTEVPVTETEYSPAVIIVWHQN